MKKFLCFLMALILALSITVTTTMAAQVGRCPLCGAENAMVFYSVEHGYCYKCHRSTDTVCLTVNVKSNALSFDECEVILYQNGRVERMAVVPSGDQTIIFSGLQKGVYTIAINMNGYVPVYQTVWLFNQETSANYPLHLRGDVNSDGIVGTADYNMVKNHVSGRRFLFGYQYQYADVNGDWRVDSRDLDILNMVVFD